MRLEKDTRPGQVMLLAMLAAAPIFLAFVLLPIALGATHVLAIRAALYLTPALAAWSLLVFFRSPADVRAHPASRIGLLTDGAALLLWVLVLVPALMGRV